MASTVIRVSAAWLALLALPAVPVAAQGQSKADVQDFQMFRRSIALRRNARVCERGAPEHSARLAELYAKWSDKHRAEIARGATLFTQALSVRDPTRYPFVDNVTLARLETGLAELAQPGPATVPTAPAAATAVACERLVAFLKQD